MGELALATGEAATDLAQGVRPPELAEQHGHELAPTREAARVPLGLRRDDGLLKRSARKELEQLTEDAAESRHSGWPSGDAVELRAPARIIPNRSTASSFSGVGQRIPNLDKSAVKCTATAKRLAANGAAPPGAEPSAVTGAIRRAPRGPRRADFARWGGSVGLFADRT